MSLRAITEKLDQKLIYLLGECVLVHYKCLGFSHILPWSLFLLVDKRIFYNYCS